ncbi:GM23763 [Drosophila sechellia]|uniref:GM23763 n=1 Tax=Drosophila sechellia TaxID=7238 RepID=B4HL12_DROSE|nr:GM23763 [Drosophila sechellia]
MAPSGYPVAGLLASVPASPPTRYVSAPWQIQFVPCAWPLTKVQQAAPCTFAGGWRVVRAVHATDPDPDADEDEDGDADAA